ncbi:hypothetical protein [Haliovirga abyssi]|uniref:Lipoprotein n=1 Tax=Haliovirga abyssi TaxID=2996794 RepID=A0AAU9DUU8_9FUSO|nr:hypothetical protein [Haliovirga abyssi]BDU49816.1 hypothetical protein HLVA_03850 [Haliovirga abyssi]
MKKILLLGVLVLLTQLGCSSMSGKKIVVLKNPVKSEKSIYFNSIMYKNFNNLDITPLARETHGISEEYKFNSEDENAIISSLQESLTTNGIYSVSENRRASDYEIKIVIPNYIVAEGYGVAAEIMYILKDRKNNKTKFYDRFAVYVELPSPSLGKDELNNAIVYKIINDINYHLMNKKTEIKIGETSEVKYYLQNNFNSIVSAVSNFPKSMKKVKVNTSGSNRTKAVYTLNNIKWKKMVVNLTKIFKLK